MSNAVMIRSAVPGDAPALPGIFRQGEPAEFAERLSAPRPESGTAYYVVELDGKLAAAFALTPLGGLAPGHPPRFLLHEIKLGRRFRGLGVPERVFAWLAETMGTGQHVDLMVLGPTVDDPPLISDLGMVKAHHAFLWAAEKTSAVDGGAR
ncbi:hypothetical protein [Streptomyces sp. NPDC058964]|uniref:hypothetical protein n=1 Tax=Streptomyces sp. NPDC058964 TaxID=3346681 RepID=UPI0036AE2565